MILTLLLAVSISSSFGANILAILPSPFYSHQIAYAHIWKELSLRGHKVTVVTTNPTNDPKLTNLTEIDMKWTYDFVANISKEAEEEITMWSMHSFFLKMFSQITDAQLSRKELQDLIHNKTSFDVVFAEFLHPEMLAFAEIYNCPKILFSTLDVYAIVHLYIGNSYHPVLYPEIGATFYGSLNFKERVLSTLFTWHLLYFYSHTAYVQRSENIRKHFNISKTVLELLSDVDMTFLNVNPILQPIRALGPSTVLIGGDREVTSKSLPNDISEFLDNAKNGFVYFSLGSSVRSKDLSKDSLEGIIKAFSELPYKVLWKFEADELPNKPDNVKLIQWAPQQTVLAHPNIKVFVTQGGLQSSEEALYRGVPFVVIPFFGDQDLNAKLLEFKGIAVVVSRLPSIKKEDLKNAIIEVATNPKYRNTVNRLRQLASDTPMTGLEKAVWWTEYVIRNKGAKHLRNPAEDLPLYEYYLVDVIGFLLATLIVSSLLLFFIVRTFYRFIVSSVKSKLSKNKKE